MNRALVALLLVGACHGEPKHVEAKTAEPAAKSAIPDDTTELLTGIIESWESTTATLQRYHRVRGGPWLADGVGWTAVIGSGAGWGSGLHGDGPPAGHSGPIKHEGDGKSPAGVFALTGSYGYAPTEPARAQTAIGLPYRQLTDEVRCIDDGADAAYNTIIDTPTTAASFERMLRPDNLYKFVVEVAHNPQREPGAGSCIFLHVWHDASHPTVGCTAMPEATISTVIGWLQREAHPVYVLLPRAEYAALSRTWSLPL